jgi:hypothetical protein
MSTLQQGLPHIVLSIDKQGVRILSVITKAGFRAPIIGARFKAQIIRGRVKALIIEVGFWGGSLPCSLAREVPLRGGDGT